MTFTTDIVNNNLTFLRALQIEATYARSMEHMFKVMLPPYSLEGWLDGIYKAHCINLRIDNSSRDWLDIFKYMQ